MKHPSWISLSLPVPFLASYAFSAWPTPGPQEVVSRLPPVVARILCAHTCRFASPAATNKKTSSTAHSWFHAPGGCGGRHRRPPSGTWRTSAARARSVPPWERRARLHSERSWVCPDPSVATPQVGLEPRWNGYNPMIATINQGHAMTRLKPRETKHLVSAASKLALDPPQTTVQCHAKRDTLQHHP
jgi:hypothetical protein